MLRLPSLWTPNFFLIGITLYERYEKLTISVRDATDNSDKVEEAYLFDVEEPSGTLWETLLTSEEYRQLECELQQVAPSEDDYIIVRSSAVDEDMGARGRYKSIKCCASMGALAKAVQDVFDSCLCDDGRCMGIVVQRFVQRRRAKGHLSNERRVCHRISSWVCEFEAVSGVGAARIVKFGVSRMKGESETFELLCICEEELYERITEVASWTYSKGWRLHFEWVWDGRRLWIVQGDESPSRTGDSPAAKRFRVGRSTSQCNLVVLEDEKKVPKGIWTKVDCVKTFREHRLPTTKLWVLRDNVVLSKLATGKMPSELRGDLISLLEVPIVIRTDIRRKEGEAKLMLPRTDTVASIGQAEEFLIEKSRSFLGEEIDRNDSLCFMFHRFIPAMASAFGLAEPQRGRVKIDGLWGLPDGLYYYPHDSYDVSTDGMGEILRHVRFKEEFLDVDDGGQWIPKRAGPPDDWKSSLTDAEIREIAKGTYAIACAEGRTIQLMWFTGIPAGLGHPTCLPWYYSTEETPKRLPYYSKTIAPKGPVVRNKDDIHRVKNIGLKERISTIRLRPIPELLRSREFVVDVAELVKEIGATVELEGSVLSHAFYLLKSCGCNVMCPDPFAPQFKPQRFGKLVRDQIPVRIKSHGEKVKVVRLSGKQLSGLLRAKAVEEALELFWSETNEQCKEELVDLLEVLKALQKHEGFSKRQLESMADDKLSKRGGFGKGLILKETQDVPLIDVGTTGSELFDELETGKDDIALLFPVHEPVIGPTPRKEGADLMVIPLVPPDAGHRHFTPEPLNYKNFGLSANIKYREKDIIVEISKFEDRGRMENPNQLKLFDF